MIILDPEIDVKFDELVVLPAGKDVLGKIVQTFREGFEFTQRGAPARP